MKTRPIKFTSRSCTFLSKNLLISSRSPHWRKCWKLSLTTSLNRLIAKRLFSATCSRFMKSPCNFVTKTQKSLWNTCHQSFPSSKSSCSVETKLKNTHFPFSSSWWKTPFASHFGVSNCRINSELKELIWMVQMILTTLVKLFACWKACCRTDSQIKKIQLRSFASSLNLSIKMLWARPKSLLLKWSISERNSTRSHSRGSCIQSLWHLVHAGFWKCTHQQLTAISVSRTLRLRTICGFWVRCKSTQGRRTWKCLVSISCQFWGK